MIGTKQLYEIFIEKEKESINSINKEIIKLNNTKKNLVRKLESYKAFINRFTNCNFDELLELTEIPTIKTTVVKNLVNNVGITDFKHQLSVIIGCNIRIRDLNDYIGTIENKILPYQAFSHVIKQGNLLYIEQLLKGNKLSLGTNLGEINIRRVKRKNLRPDWGSSNKNKKELLAKGMKLYEKVGTDENGEPVYNDGVKWLVYHTEEYYYKVHWNKSIAKIDLIVHPNFVNYVFRPTRSSSGLLSVMNESIKNNPLSHILFN